MIHYSCFDGYLDLRGKNYRVFGDTRNKKFSIRSLPDNREILGLRLSISFDGNSPETPEIKPRLADAVNGMESFSLTFENETVTMTICFRYDSVALFSTLKRSMPRCVESVVLCGGSRNAAQEIVNPAPQPMPYHRFPITEEQSIVPFLASPPPWIFSYESPGGGECWSASLEPDPDKLWFDGFHHLPDGAGTCGWKITLPKCEPETGGLVLPPLVFRFGNKGIFDALERHVEALRQEGKVSFPKQQFPAWHSGISACTWRFQSKEPRRDQATQQNCEKYVKLLEDHGLSFDILIIDDSWQKAHSLWEPEPCKWNDLRGFIDSQHKRGRHVLLWLSTWADGLPDEMKIDNYWNVEAPELRDRLRQMAHQMLSSEAGCYNADGVKFDFTCCMPKDFKQLRYKGNAYLLERFRLLAEVLLEAKPDAVLDFQCCNPYFSRFQTMLRLNDYFGLPENGLAEMRFRATIARIVAPGSIIDTDHIGFSQFSYRGGLNFFRECDSFGAQSWYLGPQDLEDPELLAILKEQSRKALTAEKKESIL